MSVLSAVAIGSLGRPRPAIGDALAGSQLPDSAVSPVGTIAELPSRSDAAGRSQEKPGESEYLSIRSRPSGKINMLVADPRAVDRRLMLRSHVEYHNSWRIIRMRSRSLGVVILVLLSMPRPRSPPPSPSDRAGPSAVRGARQSTGRSTRRSGRLVPMRMRGSSGGSPRSRPTTPGVPGALRTARGSL